MRSKQFIQVIAMMLILMLALSGCEFSGGGWMPSASGAEKAKATFGLTGYTENTWDALTIGHVSYHDKTAVINDITGVKILGEATYVEVVGRTASMTGTYMVNGIPGDFVIFAYDNGENGINAEDFLSITVLDGPYAGYHNEGLLGGGNLSFWEDSAPVE